jgi:hypothetical protein
MNGLWHGGESALNGALVRVDGIAVESKKAL